MVDRATSVNPEVLRWARERSGHSLEDVAHALRKEVSAIESWENGDLAPTMGQLDKLAYSLYKRPLAIFFFPEPPEERSPEDEFRTLPHSEIEKLTPDTLYALREARVKQLSLHELTEGNNPADSPIFKKIRPRQTHIISSLCSRVRKDLGITLKEQTEWPSAAKAFKYWRDVVERSGVYVFKSALKQSNISGFCLLDPEFPVISINSKTSFGRQSFSLFHELAHILFRSGGITKADDGYIDHLSGRDRAIEVACNEFAAEFLVPSVDFRRRAKGCTGEEHEIKALSDRYKVSGDVIFRRLLDIGLVDQGEYEARVAESSAGFHLRSEQKGGGNYYAIQVANLGENFLKLAFAQYDAERCSMQKLSEHLNMKARNVVNLEVYFPFEQIVERCGPPVYVHKDTVPDEGLKKVFRDMGAVIVENSKEVPEGALQYPQSVLVAV